MGTAMSSNLFIPLNSLDWVNKNIYTENPLKSPLVTHLDLLYFIAFISFSFGLYIFIFIREKNVENTERKSMISMFIHDFPRMFSNKNNLLLIFYVFLTYAPDSLLGSPTGLNFVKYGMSKTDLTNLSSIVFIPSMLICMLSAAFIKKGK